MRKTSFARFFLSLTTVVYVAMLPSTASSGEGAIEFKIHEKFTNKFDGPHLYITGATEKIFRCSNYLIDHKMKKDGNKIDIILGKANVPGLCATAFGPAHFYQDLTIGEGVFSLQFHSGGQVDKYTLTITDTSAVIEPVTSTFTKANPARVERLPPTLLWATCFFNSNKKWLFNPADNVCERFFNDIESLSTPYFTVGEDKTPKTLFYLYTGESSTLLNMIRDYDLDGYYVRISTWEGRNYICPSWNYISPRKCDSGHAYVPEVKNVYTGKRKPVADISECNGSVLCIMRVASNKNDEEICLQLPPENQHQCYGKVGMAKLDESLCAKAEQGSSGRECYTFVAIMREEPDLCEEITQPGSREDCYVEYAQAQKDRSFCDRVEGERRRERCLNYFRNVDAHESLLQ